MTNKKLEEENSENNENGVYKNDDGRNMRSYESVGMERLIPSLRQRQHSGKHITVFINEKRLRSFN